MVKNNKKPLKNAEVIGILVTYYTVFGLLLSYSFKIEKKLEPKRKEYVNEFVNSNNYNISNLVVVECEDDRKEVMLGYIPYTDKYYDIDTSTFYKIEKNKKYEEACIKDDTIYTPNVKSLRKYLPKEYIFKFRFDSEELNEIEDYINNENVLKRKLS